MHILHEFATNTSIAPIPAIGRAKSFKVKMIWAFIFGVSIGMLIYQTVELVQRYLEYPKTIEINLLPKSAKFPWMTLCNSEYLGYSAYTTAVVDDGSETSKLMQEVVIKYDTLWRNLIIPLDTYVKRNQTELEPLITYLNMTYNLMQVITDQAQMAASIPNFKSLGIPLKHLKALCMFGDEACKDSDFHDVFDPYYHKCYTYKPDENIALPGRKGLGLVLFSEAGLYNPFQVQLEAMDSLLKTSPKNKGLFNMDIDQKSIKVFIHPPNTKPGYYRQSISIGPGQYTKIQLKETLIKRITTPIERCQKRKVTKWEGIEYDETFIDCQRQCIFDYVKNSCGCHLPEEVIGMDEEHNVTVCFTSLIQNLNHLLNNYNNLNSSEQITGFLNIENSDLCGKKAYDEAFTRKVPCNCDLPCEERDFTIVSSSLPWPKHIVEQSSAYGIFDDIFHTGLFHTHFTKDEQDTMQIVYGVNFSEIDDKLLHDAIYTFPVDYQEKILQHFTLVDIHFSNTDVEVIEEKRAYSGVNLCSDFGGVVGLWVGITFVTAFEVVELFIHSIMACCIVTKVKDTKGHTRNNTNQGSGDAQMSHENSYVGGGNKQEGYDIRL